MFQGGRDAERRNRATFGFDARDIGFVLLSHAHIDRSGLLPRLATQGFRGPAPWQAQRPRPACGAA